MRMKFYTEYQQKKDNIIFDSRASAILYRFLINQKEKGFVILPVNMCPIVKEIVLITGFSPYYVDIDKQNYNINQKVVFDIVKSNKIFGVIVNHTYGVEYNFNPFFKKLKTNWQGFIIEDSCLSKPSFIANEMVDLTLFSFGYAKYLELENGGGYGIVKNKVACDYKSCDITTADGTVIHINQFDYSIKDIINELNIKLLKIEHHKREINEIYNSNLKNISLNLKFSNWRYNIFVDNKEVTLNNIFKNGLFASSHYKPLSDDKVIFPVAWNLYEHVINLFNDMYFDIEMAKKIVEIIK